MTRYALIVLAVLAALLLTAVPASALFNQPPGQLTGCPPPTSLSTAIDPPLPNISISPLGGYDGPEIPPILVDGARWNVRCDENGVFTATPDAVPPNGDVDSLKFFVDPAGTHWVKRTLYQFIITPEFPYGVWQGSIYWYRLVTN